MSGFARHKCRRFLFNRITTDWRREIRFRAEISTSRHFSVSRMSSNRSIYARICVILRELKPFGAQKWNGYPRRVVESVVGRKREKGTREERPERFARCVPLLNYGFIVRALRLSSIHRDFLVDECTLIAALLMPCLIQFKFKSWRLLFCRVLTACPI